MARSRETRRSGLSSLLLKLLLPLLQLLQKLFRGLDVRLPILLLLRLLLVDGLLIVGGIFGLVGGIVLRIVGRVSRIIGTVVLSILSFDGDGVSPRSSHRYGRRPEGGCFLARSLGLAIRHAT